MRLLTIQFCSQNLFGISNATDCEDYYKRRYISTSTVATQSGADRYSKSISINFLGYAYNASVSGGKRS